MVYADQRHKTCYYSHLETAKELRRTQSSQCLHSENITEAGRVQVWEAQVACFLSLCHCPPSPPESKTVAVKGFKPPNNNNKKKMPSLGKAPSDRKVRLMRISVSEIPFADQLWERLSVQAVCPAPQRRKPLCAYEMTLSKTFLKMAMWEMDLTSFRRRTSVSS